MKTLLLIALFFTATICHGQTTAKLFAHSGLTGNGRLGYIQYPQEQYHGLDTIEITDMKVINSNLYVSGTQIWCYDLNTLQKTDSINITSVDIIGNDSQNLIVARSQSPYFQVYNLVTKSLVFSLDTAKVKLQPNDMLIDEGRAYLLYDTSIVIVDLALQDTLATRTASYHSWFPCFNQYLINDSGRIFIHVGIATGAPRFAVLSMDKSSLVVQSVLFQEFVDAYYRPILAGDKLYMSYFPSHYDITADTFVFNQGLLNCFPLHYDKTGNTFFLYNPLSLNIAIFHNSQYSNGVIIPGYINNSAFFIENGAGLWDKNHDRLVNIYPNPVDDKLFINVSSGSQIKSLRIYAPSGTLETHYPEQSSFPVKLDVGHLKPGMYIIEILGDDFRVIKKFVKLD